jgi:tetratricopeptide (TPR) repeat protein
VVSGRVRKEMVQDVPMSVTAVTEESIVMTARRKTQSEVRGDWNACTVNDPRQSLAGCARLVRPSEKSAVGRADADVADGLARAWRGDIRGAITAFDRAIEAAPRHGFAYLNRGLAYQRLGDLQRALADLNHAVRYSPNARSYYNRSLLLRQQGNVRGARNDEQRAIELDPRYVDIVG